MNYPEVNQTLKNEPNVKASIELMLSTVIHDLSTFMDACKDTDFKTAAIKHFHEIESHKTEFSASIITNKKL